MPQPLDFGFAETLVTHSPFTRSVNLEESLQLTGVAYVDGHPVATILNKATQERLLVSEEANAQGWKLTSVAAGTDLSNTQIEMMVGPEIITMHYQGGQLSPGNEVQGSSRSRLAKDGPNNKSGEKFRPSSLLGEGGREQYASLSPDARSKFRDLIKSHLEKQPDQTPEQSQAYAQRVFAKIKDGDRPTAGGSSPKVPKTGKTNKKKQGA